MWTRIPRRVIPALTLAFLAACAGTAGGATDTRRPRDVAIGYGSSPADRLATSVQSLDSTTVVEGTAVDFLRGRVTGLRVIETPGGEIELRLRGITSVHGSNNPLLVIDGVPVFRHHLGSVLRAIPGREIAQVDVLKDAAATAIYGSRGAAGVIMIRTRTR